MSLWMLDKAILSKDHFYPLKNNLLPFMNLYNLFALQQVYFTSGLIAQSILDMKWNHLSHVCTETCLCQEMEKGKKLNVMKKLLTASQK